MIWRIFFVFVAVCISTVGNTREIQNKDYRVYEPVQICVKTPDLTPRQAIEVGYGGSIDKRLLLAICERESGCNQSDGGRVLRSKGGQIGAMQIDPVNYSKCDSEERVETTIGNVQCAGLLLEELLKKYSLVDAVAAYNGGVQSLRKSHKHHKRAYAYAKAVLKTMKGETK